MRRAARSDREGKTQGHVRSRRRLSACDRRRLGPSKEMKAVVDREAQEECVGSLPLACVRGSCVTRVQVSIAIIAATRGSTGS
jgi:hypothetical protein